jgi:hypothetical protein
MRNLISSLAALSLSLPGAFTLAPVLAPVAAVPAIIIAAPVTVAVLGPREAEARPRRGGGHRAGGHSARVRSGGRHTVNRGVHHAAQRPHPGRPDYRPGAPGRPGYRPAHHGHYTRNDVYHHYRPGYRGYYGYGAGVAAGVATSLAIGTVVAALPSGCTSTTINGVYYQRCNGTWYAPRYSGSDVTYVVVEEPR